MVSLENVTSVKEFLSLQYSKKVQQAVLGELEKLYTKGRINIQEGTTKEIPLLFKFNEQQFSREWLDIMKEFMVDIFTITVDKHIKAVSFSVIDSYTYLPLTIGYDKKISSLRSLLLISQLQRAIEHGRSIFDPERITKEWSEVFPAPTSRNTILAPTFQYQLN